MHMRRRKAHALDTRRRTVALITRRCNVYPPELLADPYHGMTPERFRALLGGCDTHRENPACRTQALALRLSQGPAQAL